MIKWKSENISNDHKQNDPKKKMVLRIGVAPIKEKVAKNHERWFGNVQSRTINVIMIKSNLIQVKQMKKSNKNVLKKYILTINVTKGIISNNIELKTTTKKYV